MVLPVKLNKTNLTRLFLASALVLTGLMLGNLKVSAACSTANPDLGSAAQTINIAASGTYRVWSRIMVPDATANSFAIEVDGGTCVTVGDYSIPANSWTWVDYQAGNTSSKINLSLTAGNHTIKIIGREAGVKLDRVILTSNLSCTPHDTGEDCVVAPDITPPTVTLTSPSPVDNAPLSGIVTMAATAYDASGINKVDFKVDGVVVNSDTTYPYSYDLDTTTLTDSSHTLSAIAYDNAGLISTNSNVVVSVDNQPDPLADLVITSITISPASPLPGNQVLFAAVVKNQGNAPTTLGVKHGVQFKVDGNIASWHGNDTTTTIPAGGTAALAANNGPTGTAYWPATEGSHTVTAHVDDLGLIAESNNNNNTLDKAFTVSPPPDTQAPSVPGGVQVTANNATQVSVSWQASTDNVGVAGYYVSRNGTTIATVTSGTAYTDNSVLPSTSYAYSISAFDASNNFSVFSSEVTVQTPQAPDSQAPTVPTGVAAVALSSSQIRVLWNASTDNIGVAGYDIYRSDGSAISNPSKIATVTSATTSYGDTGLSANSDYTYYVVAKDSAGNESGQSSSATATTFASAENGNIFGYVRDSSTNDALSGATVRVYLPDGSRINAKTNKSGAYLVTNLAAGNYDIFFNARFYNPKTSTFNILPATTIPGNVTLDRK